MKKCNKCGSKNADNLKYCGRCGYELPKPEVEEIQPQVQKPMKKVDFKKLIGIIVGAITFIMVYFLVQQLLFNTPKLDKVMMKTASEINESCPMMVDSETRLDNTIVLPSNVFQYNYTLVNMEKETIDFMALKDYIEPNIINFVRTNPDMKFQRDNKVTINYYYKDKYGNYIFTISVTPEQYE
jgi:hypothetical protein